MEHHKDSPYSRRAAVRVSFSKISFDEYRRTVNAAVARDLIRQGIPTAPASAHTKVPFKNPVIGLGHGFKDRTTDPSRIELWIKHYPGCMWIVAPADIGAIVFDDDKPLTRSIAERMGIWPPKGFAVKTPGGWHLYYQSPPDLTGGRTVKPEDVGLPKQKLGPNDKPASLVVRRDAGYVIADGCVRADKGHYQARGRLQNMAPLPDAAAQLLRHLGDPDRQRETARPSPNLDKVSPDESVIDAFNRAHKATAILEAHQYQRKGKRYLAPTSESGLAGVVLFEDGGVFSHHGSDPLNDGHAHDAFDLFRILDHGGDVRKAVHAAAEALGMDYAAQSKNTDKATGSFSGSISRGRTIRPSLGGNW